jgi:2-oxoglutarate dehydrogenase E1 component
MTPKSLLRNALAASPPAEFGPGTSFLPVLDDPFFTQTETASKERVERVILCSGKVYVDLATSDARSAADRVALVRVEQLYTFPSDAIEHILSGYPGVREVVWLQEEPRNMGAWTFVSPRLRALLVPRGVTLRYIGRPERASPSEGAPAWHAAKQARIVAQAFAGFAPRGSMQATATTEPETAQSVAQASKVSS